jgi:hypothetical protein
VYLFTCSIEQQHFIFYDEADLLLPVPEFARELNITVEDLFSWLLE